MKLFGKKSLSSFLGIAMKATWIVTLLVIIAIPFISAFIILITTPRWEADILSHIKSGPGKAVIAGILSKDYTEKMDEKEKKEWESFETLPVWVKLLILPYMEIVVILLFLVARKSVPLFQNFRDGKVFEKGNVKLVRTISKLLIGFSIASFSFSTLFLSVILLMVCAILDSGTVLQEEHDLTI